MHFPGEHFLEKNVNLHGMDVNLHAIEFSWMGRVNEEVERVT
jgi:hypothetical protein